MISIIIPIYNSGKELERLLKSVQNQSFTDYEVIMIDDGSCDNSAEICKKFSQNDERFKYFYQENKGVSIARNNGLKNAKGDYITFLDADDVIDSDYLKVLTSEDADIVVCDVVVEVDGKEKRHFVDDELDLNKDEAMNLLLKREIINSGPCAKLFKREIIGEINFPVMKTYEDILFCLEVFLKAATVKVTPKTRYHYIENSRGAMSSMLKAPSTDIIVASEKILEFIKATEKVRAPECFYVTLSHVFQYVLSMVCGECEWNKDFIIGSKALFKKYFSDILKCNAVPKKEKVVFICYTFGWIYTNKKWVNVNKTR